MTTGNNATEEAQAPLTVPGFTTTQSVELTPSAPTEGAKKEEKTLIDLYAFNYHMYYQPFCNYIDRMSLKSLRRIMKALVKFPLEQDEFKPHGATTKERHEEKHAFGIGHQTFFAKYMMVCLTQIESEMNKIENKEDNAVSTAQPTTEVKETSETNKGE